MSAYASLLRLERRHRRRPAAATCCCLTAAAAAQTMHRAPPPQDFVNAVLTGVRPGLSSTAATATATATSPPPAITASKLAALRLATYKASLARLGVTPAPDPAAAASSDADGAFDPSAAAAAAAPVLSERQAAQLVSVLDGELGSTHLSAVDLAEVGWAGGAVRRCAAQCGCLTRPCLQFTVLCCVRVHPPPPPAPPPLLLLVVLQVAECALAAFEGDGPLACAALELLPKALALLAAAGGELLDAPGDGSACQVSGAPRPPGLMSPHQEACEWAMRLGCGGELCASTHLLPRAVLLLWMLQTCARASCSACASTAGPWPASPKCSPACAPSRCEPAPCPSACLVSIQTTSKSTCACPPTHPPPLAALTLPAAPRKA